MIRLNLRRKLLLLAVGIAILPLLIAGQSLIRIARDELKSSANDQLITTAQQITDEVYDLYEHAWLAPLLLIRNAVDSEQIGIQEKISLLTLGISNLTDVVALQITAAGAAVPLVVSQETFSDKLKAAGLDPLSVLRTDKNTAMSAYGGEIGATKIDYVAESDDWLATVYLPLRSKLAGSIAVLSARIDLSRLRTFVDEHAFSNTGTITIVDGQGRQVLASKQSDLNQLPIVQEALQVLKSQYRTISVEPYARPDGTVMLGAFAFTEPFEWAVLAEKNEKDAYLTVDLMIRSLGIWIAAGLAVAALGAVIFATRMSRPILAIGEAANAVADGDFQARVDNVHSRDEIGELAGRINNMIVQLNERFQLRKFVSDETMSAIRSSDATGVRLGGDRRQVVILFADIRGYTEFAEHRDPEVVVDVLNHYFQSLADIVSAHHGDIDKYVGDQIMAIFQGPNMARDAVDCALALQEVMVELGAENPDWELDIGVGVDIGDVVMGAMGSKNRMDYTVLGDHVNLAARLCAAAEAKQTLVSHDVREAIDDQHDIAFQSLDPIRVKGKSTPIVIYAALPGQNTEKVWNAG